MGIHLITMPDVGEGTAEVEITEWLVEVGDAVREDDVLCIVMTDKAAVEIPSPVDGVLLWRAAEAGETMAVGSDFVRLETDGAGKDATDGERPAPEAATKPPSPAPAQEQAPATPKQLPDERTSRPAAAEHRRRQAVEQEPRRQDAPPIAPPSVRKRARDLGINLHCVPGSGPAGRITPADLDEYLEHGRIGGDRPTSASRRIDTAVSDRPVSGLRAEIARRMQSTMQRIPHYSYIEAIDVTELEALRKSLNARNGEDRARLTILPFIIRGLVRALREHPEINARFDDEKNVVSEYGAVHAGIATQTDRGLLVTVVRHAESLSIYQLAAEVRRLSDAARSGRITAAELTGSTITLSSLGPFGGIATTPVINAPEVAIVGINKLEQRPVWQGDRFVPRTMMNLSSSFDHRVIDGWEATQFIHCLKGYLESPATLFMEEE